jgi:hypothetical protein
VSVNLALVLQGLGGRVGLVDASQVTLKYGFELMVRRIAPEIVDIVDTTDRASGTKPFCQHAGEVQ